MVSDDLFPWKRFWYPRSGQVSLADDGFLIDPDSESAHYFQSDAIAFEALDTKPCLVFLGEQGIGKSNALWAEYELIKEWSAGNGDLALWFDLETIPQTTGLNGKSSNVQRSNNGPMELAPYTCF